MADQINKPKNVLRTWTGTFVDPLNLKVEDVDIHDIARALSNTCRYAGMCNFYSVAEHSVHVSRALDNTEDKLLGLLHDAT